MAESTERADRIRTLFTQALDLSAAERDAFLAEQCAGDDGLQAEVLSLLAFEPGNAYAPALPTGGIAMQILLLPPGTRMGPFTVRRHLGSGASSDVYLARQDEPEREVALKVLREGAAREQAERFERESGVLARLNHPNVAKVYQVGRAEDGRPWIAMELVAGRTLIEYAREARLSLRQRLALFVTLCDALEHIHQNGLIHRDLKPDNVIVPDGRAAPAVKVLDFGIAKAQPGPFASASAGATMDGSLLGTLEYASPEQLVDSRRVDVRSDLYSAGVLLQELLTGVRPFNATAAGLADFVQQVRLEDPPAPSAQLRARAPALAAAALDLGLTPGALLRTLGEDLDWIVLKCLRREPRERYASAGDLRADLQRALEGSPVAARPPGRGYRLRKFVRRHRTGVIAGSLATFALLVGFASTAIQFGLSTRRLRSLETLTADLVASVNEIVDIPGAMEAKGRLAASAAQALEQLGQRTLGVDGRRRLADAYERLGQLRGDSYSASLGQVVEGAADLWRALQLRREVLAARGDSVSQAEYLHTAYLTSLVAQAGAPLVRYDSLLAAAHREGEAMAGQHPGDLRIAGELAAIEDLLGEVRSEGGQWAESMQLARQAYARRCAIAAGAPDHEPAQGDLSQSLQRLAYNLTDPDSTRRFALQALRIHEQLHERHPSSYRADLQLSYALRVRAYTLHRVDSLAAALAAYERLVALRREMALSDTTDLRSRHQYLVARLWLACGLTAAHMPERAVPEARAAMAEYARIVAHRPQPRWAQTEYSDAHRRLATVERYAGNTDAALAAYAVLCSNGTFASTPEMLRRWRNFNNHAHLLRSLGRVQEADSVFDYSFGMLHDVASRLSFHHSDAVPFADVALAMLHLAQVRAPAGPAAVYLARARALLGPAADSRDVLANVENEWACQLAARGEADSAEAMFRLAREHAGTSGAQTRIEQNQARLSAWRMTPGTARAAERTRWLHALAYAGIGDPYARLDLVMFRHYPVWGDMPPAPIRLLGAQLGQP